MPSPLYLRLVVFTAGACTLGLELAASNLLAPYFGTSRTVWASVIGLTLLCMAAGYTLGGRLADRRPHLWLLCALLAAAGMWILLIPAVSRPILLGSLARLAGGSLGVLVGSLLAVMALLSIPIVLLSMTSPLAMRLAVRDLDSTGRTAGALYGLSTAGSIVGTFVPTLLVTPLIGTSRTLLLLGVVLLLVALPGWWSQRRRAAWVGGFGILPVLTAAGVTGAGVRPAPPGMRLLHEEETAYQYLQVAAFRDARGEVRALLLNNGSVHSLYLPRFERTGDPRDLLTSRVWDYFLVAPYFTPRRDPSTIHSLALIGSGASTTPRQFLAVYGAAARVDAVEIDPRVVAAGRKYLGMRDGSPEHPRYRVHVQDGRAFLNHTEASYDLIGVDAYRSTDLLPHLSTREFFTTVRRHLNPAGVAALNVYGGRFGAKTAALADTMRSVFPEVYVLRMPFSDTLVVGLNRPAGDGVRHFRENYRRIRHPALRQIMAPLVEGGEAPWIRRWERQETVFTDDWAPLEWYQEGARLARQLGR